MCSIDIFPDRDLPPRGHVSRLFRRRGVNRFLDACRMMRDLPYGYNRAPKDPLSALIEGRGTCITKHRVIALLAHECRLPVHQSIGVYALDEGILAGAGRIGRRFGIPWIPAVHCFLSWLLFDVDLTATNATGKKSPVETFLRIERLRDRRRDPFEAKDRLWNLVTRDLVDRHPDFGRVDVECVRRAYGEALVLFRKTCRCGLVPRLKPAA